MATKKFLQGQLNQPISRPTYTGGKTDSLEIVVNNSEMTVTGNVIWDNFIGTTLGQAYPGVDGARNYKAILKLTDSINDNIEQFINYKNITNSRLSAIENIAQDIDTAVSEKLAKEVARSTAKDKELLDNLIVESQRALAAEAEFVNKLELEALLRSDLDNELKAEIELLSNNVFTRIEQLSKSIDAIMNKIDSVETTLIQQITSENIRAVTAEKELRSLIAQTNDSVAKLRSEIANSNSNTQESTAASFTDLINKINEETARATRAETDLHKIIDAVDTRVTDVESSLSSRIIKEETSRTAKEEETALRIDELENKHTEDVLSLYSAINTANSAVNTLKKQHAVDINQLVEKMDASLDALQVSINENETLDSKFSADVDKRFENVSNLIQSTQSMLSSDIDAEAKTRAEAVDELDARIEALDSTTTQTAKQLNTVEAVVTKLEKESAESAITFTHSVNTLDTKIDAVESSLQTVIEAEVTRSTNKDVELAQAVVDATALLEASDEELDTKIASVNAQLDELKTITTTSTENVIRSVDELHKQVKDLQTLTTPFEEHFSLLDATDEELQKQIEALQSELESVELDLQSTHNQVEENTTNLATATEQLYTIAEEVKSLEGSLTEQQEQLDSVVAQIVDESKRATSAEEIIIAQQTAAENAITKNSEDIASLNAQTAALESVVSVNEKNIAEARVSINTLSDKQSALEGRVESVKTDINTLEERVETIENSNECECAEQVEKVSADLTNIKQEQLAIVNSLTDFGRKDSELESRIDKLESADVTLQTILNDEIRRSQETDQVISNIEEKLDSTIETYNVTIEELKSKDSELDSDIGYVLSKIDTITGINQNQQVLIEDLVDKVDAAKVLLDTALTDIDTTAMDVETQSVRITAVESRIDAELPSINSAINSIDATVKKQQSTILNNSTKVNELANEVTGLKTANQSNGSAVAELYNKLSEEITVREQAVSLLDTKIAAVQKKSNDTDTSHEARLSSLESNLPEVEARLNQAITTRSNESKLRDEALDAKINLNFDVLAETMQTSDDELSANIWDERIDRNKADKELQSQITSLTGAVNSNTEILKTSTSCISSLSQITDKTVSDVEKLQQTTDVLLADSHSYVKKQFTDTPHVYAQDGTSTTMIPITTGAASSGIVVRTEEGNIQLPADITKIGAADAVPKSYVESLINDVRDILYDEIKNFSFDIIDGGNAPIKK